MSSPRLAFALLCATFLVASASCVFTEYADDDPGCPEAASEVYRPPLRNPFTGQCQPQPAPRPCGVEVLTSPTPPWGACNTHCEVLGESACAADPGCHAVYVESCPSDMTCVASERQFAGCWGLAPLPGGGVCSELDAQACAGRADCVGLFSSPTGTPDPTRRWQFTDCAPERADTGACNHDDQCGDGQRCNLRDYCLPPPGCDVVGGACPPVCYGTCEPDPASCALVDCRPGHHCEVSCLPSPPIACIDPSGKQVPCPDVCKATCVPDDVGPGSCRGPVACDSLPPACPPGTLPGIGNGCWTGYCIPLHACSP